MAVSLQQLRYFVAVSEERQITAAARRLHMAQPALSQAIHALERDLGVDLPERGRQGVTPTAAGARFRGWPLAPSRRSTKPSPTCATTATAAW